MNGQQSTVQLFVNGQKDGVPRRVEHISRGHNMPDTPVINEEKNFRGHLMFLYDENGTRHSQVIRVGRVMKKVIRPTGPLA